MHPLLKQKAMNTYCGIGGTAPRILNLSIRREWSALRSGRLTPTQRIGGWVGP